MSSIEAQSFTMRTKNMTQKKMMMEQGSSARALKSDLVTPDQRHAHLQISPATKLDNKSIIRSQRRVQNLILLLLQKDLSSWVRLRKIMTVAIAIQVMMKIITKNK